MEKISKTNQRVFISYSSQDKSFVRGLAFDLKDFGVNVWYDDWEIQVGDSIVEKIFDGLEISDILIVVLSPFSVASNWVKEELSTTVMRKISETSILILPILISPCEIPFPLRHIKYADFTNKDQEGLYSLLDVILPGQLIKKTLSQHYDHFSQICDHLLHCDLNSENNNKLFELRELFETVVNLRTELELRRSRKKLPTYFSWEKAPYLLEHKGIDIRSKTYNILIETSNDYNHRHPSSPLLLMFAENLKRRYTNVNSEGVLKAGFTRLQEIMYKICFENLD